jgi:hypothetical protein
VLRIPREERVVAVLAQPPAYPAGYRQIGAGNDNGLDPRRQALTAAQAGLLEACATQWAELPPAVAARTHAAAAAFDAATGQRLGRA